MSMAPFELCAAEVDHGLRSSTSFASATLQQSLASRLQALLDSHGSTMFTLTWKAQVTPLRRPICALLASAPRTSGSGCTGRPTAISNDATGSTYCYSRRDKTKKALKLPGAVLLASWPTAKASDADKGVRTHQGALKELGRKGSGSDLPTMAAASLAIPAAHLISGAMSNGSNAATEKPGQLNPAFSRWLMGYPKEWCEAAIMARRSMRTTRRKPE